MLRSTSLNLFFLGNKCLEIRIRIRLDIYWKKPNVQTTWNLNNFDKKITNLTKKLNILTTRKLNKDLDYNNTEHINDKKTKQFDKKQNTNTKSEKLLGM